MRLSTVDHSGVTWRKSTRSGGSDAATCVEIAFPGSTVAVRDSKNPTTTPITFSAHEWSTFLDDLAR